MKISLQVIASIFILLSCNHAPDKSTVTPAVNKTQEKQRFFPVTAFIKGQIYDLKSRGINPLKYVTENNHTDSSWVKTEQLDAELHEFLHPVIDTANLITLFTETSFFDQSIDAITLTYDASGPLPDTMQLKHWDVYIDFDSQNVKRIYLVKEIDNNKTLQLTWVSNQWCKITSITTDKNGNSIVEKEVKLFWDF